MTCNSVQVLLTLVSLGPVDGSVEVVLVRMSMAEPALDRTGHVQPE